MRISRQSEYYGGSEEALSQSLPLLSSGHRLRGISVTASSSVHPSLQNLMEECKTSDSSGSDMAIVEAFTGLHEDVINTHPRASYLMELQRQGREHEASYEDMALVEELARLADQHTASRTAAEPGGVLPWVPSEAHKAAAESFSFGHLLSGPGIGRQGEDPREL